MVNKFQLNDFLGDAGYAHLQQHFGIQKITKEELVSRIQNAFLDYILAALSELGDQREDKSKIYIEAQFHLEKARALLEAMPHPAGKMASKLGNMNDTLHKLVIGSDSFSASRASRFMEKNLVRKLRDIWLDGSGKAFVHGADDELKGARDYILFCFRAAGAAYPDITWFHDVGERVADMLIKSVRKQ